MAHTIFLLPFPHLSTPSTSTNSMEQYNKRVPATVTASRLIQTRKRLKKILERPKIWMSSVIHTQMLVDPHLEVQDASTCSVSSLMTRHDSITCQSTSLNSADDLNLPLLSEPPPNSHCPVQNDEDKHRDRETAERAFSDDSELEVLEDDYTTLQYHLSNGSEEPECCQYSATVLSWPNDTAPPPLTMWHQSAEIVASFDSIDEVQAEDPNLFVNMLCGVSSVVIDTSKTENSNQDTRDIGLRVVITPPDDNWETSTVHNRIGPQYFPSLVVPPFYQFTSRLIKYEEWMAIYHPPAGTSSHDQLAAVSGRTSAGPLVFSPTSFQKRLQETKNDRFNNCCVVTALQRHQLKAAAFTASIKASLFRMRYDTPEFLENIEPRFKWIDPAEILIESFRDAPQSVTIHTSPRPCSVPHIVIHESPPNDPYVVWSNSADSQNYCFLAISSPNPSLWRKDDCQMADYCLTDDSSSLCDSSTPVTPKDFSSSLEEDLDILFGEGTGETQHCDHTSQRYEDEFVVPQYSSRHSSDTTCPSKSKFFIPDEEEEEDDDLPPLDDWYIAIANRCMAPEEAKAVAAAAATMSAVSSR